MRETLTFSRRVFDLSRHSCRISKFEEIARLLQCRTVEIYNTRFFNNYVDCNTENEQLSKITPWQPHKNRTHTPQQTHLFWLWSSCSHILFNFRYECSVVKNQGLLFAGSEQSKKFNIPEEVCYIIEQSKYLIPRELPIQTMVYTTLSGEKAFL